MDRLQHNLRPDRKSLATKIMLRALSACALCIAGLSHAQTNRIVCLGDSITQSDQSHVSYRYELWKMLVDSGIGFDFVGSSSSNNLGNPVWQDYQGQIFDPDHEGHWGRRADQVLGQLSSWLNNYTPDIALIHVGSNDMNQGESHSSTKDEIKQIISALRSDNPNIAIVLSKLIPWSGKEAQIQDLNDNYIATIPGETSTTLSPVILVDQFTGFNASADTFDGIHPNASGEFKVALNFFNALHLLNARSALDFSGQLIGPNAFQLNIQMDSELQYRVEMSSNATAQGWQELALLQGQGTTNIVDISFLTNCFYRIQLELRP